MRLYTPPNAKLVPPQAKLVFKGIIYDVYQWEQDVFDGTKKTFEMLKRPDTIRIVALKDNKMVIVKQEQPHIGSFIDVPGGMNDKGSENELDAAKRELLEETGLICKDWKLLSAKQQVNKIETFHYIFLAYNSEEKINVQKLDSGEKIEVEYLSFDEVKSLFDSPEVRFLPKDILNEVNSFEELITLPSLLH
jgi:ADP-ribose pyrophosphatase